MQWLRQNVIYLAAILGGFAIVPIFAYTNVWDFVVTHLLKFLFLASTVTLIIMVWLVKDDFRKRSIWVVAEVLFIVLMLPVVMGSGALLYESVQSWQGDEVHWHANYAVVIDGEERDLIDPNEFCEDDYICRLGNHTGDAKFHEHSDKRIHIHGPVRVREDVTLSTFFETFGGTLTAEKIQFRTNDGWVNRSNRDRKTVKILVQQGAEETRQWCVLTPVTEDTPQCTDVHTGEPVSDPAEYVISPYRKDPLDDIFVLYDDVSAEDALADVQSDGRYTLG